MGERFSAISAGSDVISIIRNQRTKYIGITIVYTINIYTIDILIANFRFTIRQLTHLTDVTRINFFEVTRAALSF